jgi:translation initiation factor 1 (eIF-1/SUI1)
MNPFDDQPTTDIIDTKKFKIDIWIETKGRKCITFISGWNIEDNIMKDHLKIIKKFCSCNGSFKTEDDNKLLQLQGDHVKYMFSYLIQQNIDDKSIIIRGNSIV